MRRCVRVTLTVFIWLATVPAAAYAQASITGVVRDTSGAVLPGVTVEAASPALIERVRSVVTDGTGQYRIVDLRPGTYTVTFTLPGFATVRREGIELTGSFVATVNAELRVGALEETITVTGETPVVDVQSTTRQSVLDRELISVLPSGRNAATMTALLPGVTMENPDVGGLGGEAGSRAGKVTVHGVDEPRTLVRGVSVHSAGSGTTGVANIAAYQELVVDVGGISVEQREGGVRMNLIPREGGNTFAGSFYGAFANGSMQGNNFTQELKDRGLRTPNTLKSYGDVNPAFGGPIKRDHLWFHATARYNVARNFVPLFFNKHAGNPNVWIYEADTSRPPVADNSIWKGANARVTWQATPRHKLAVAYDHADSCQCPLGAGPTTSVEAGRGKRFLRPKRMLFGDWAAPVTSRLLLEANVLKHDEHAWSPSKNTYFTHDPGPVKMIEVQEQSTNLRYRASSSITDVWSRPFQARLAVSYVTGAHALKVGFEYGRASEDVLTYSRDSPMSFRFNNGVPNRLTLRGTPYAFKQKIDAEDALFVQDRWTVHRMTLSAGLRYDYHHNSFPAATIGPGDFVPTRNFVIPAEDGLRWHDISPRGGVAFDVFGDGKTALKVGLGKYLAAENLSSPFFARDMAPANRLVNTTNRSWQDANRNFVPDCDLLNPEANGECGTMSNPDFGSIRRGLTYDPEVLRGWGKRSYNWQFSAGLQRELAPRVSLDVSYFRTWFGSFMVIDDRAVGPSDFERFSITAPVDPRLPDGGGYVVSGLYDLKPAAFGRPADNYLTLADTYDKQIGHWNGVDVTLNARPRSGLTFQGGTSTGRMTTDICDLVDDVPELLLGAQNVGEANDDVWLPVSYCHQQAKFLTQVKLLGTYTIPRVDVQVTGTFQSRPGPQIVANYVASNAVVAPSLGRNLAGGARNITVNIVEPGTMYGERMNQIDLRVGKILRFGRTRATVSLDLYNALNANPVIRQNNAFAAWQQPQSILNPRWAKIIGQLDF